MIFHETELQGCFVIELERKSDERGFFARSFCTREFRDHGLSPCVEQCNVSWNAKRHTLRGLHYQTAPSQEAKLVRCTRGALFDVAVDLRPDSPTRFRHVGVELTADSRRMLYIPESFAHGFLTLDDDTEVHYQMSEPYAPEVARGLRFDDPTLDIAWPASPAVISERDRGYPDLAPDALGALRS